MPEEDKENRYGRLDTSGPEVEVELPQEKEEEERMRQSLSKNRQKR